MKFLAFCMVLVAALAGQAQTQGQLLDANLKTKLQQEIDYIGNLYGTAYAPKTWKETHLGWNLANEVAVAKTKLLTAQTMTDARQIVADLINSTADYHVSFSFYATEKATLPFQVKTVQGKTLIVYIDRTKLSEVAFPFHEGDELLTMDQMPVAQVQSAIVTYIGANIPETDVALTDLYITKRSANVGAPVPHGPVTLALKRAADDSVGTVTLSWEYTPEQLSQKTPFSLARMKKSLFQKMMIGSKAMPFVAEDAQQAENTFSLGVKKPFLPNFGERIWETAADNSFDAYIYQNEEGQLIGVIRISQYIVDDYNKAVKDFAGIIQHFEKHTAAMVIDQNNNPGGSVFYLYALASMMSDQALTVPKHKIALTAAEASECVALNQSLASVKNDEDAKKALESEMSGYPGSYQMALGMRDYCDMVLREFQEGKSLSTAYYLWGVDKITPNAIHYTKPVVLLVNQLDFSGGDFFPAIMQDNKRVTIVGTRTAGAGGFVLEATFPNNIGLETVRFTGSIAERVNLNPIENLGVTPDVNLPITVSDIRNGFKDYQDEVRTVLKTLIK